MDQNSPSRSQRLTGKTNFFREPLSAARGIE